MDYAFAYVQKNGGIDTEASYPYEAKARKKNKTVSPSFVKQIQISSSNSFLRCTGRAFSELCSSQNDVCRFKNDTIGAVDYGFLDIEKGDELALQAAVAEIGPISVAIDASQTSFQSYS